MTAPLVQALGIAKNYKRGSEIVHALTGIDIELHSGEVVALIGPSGSGKSTLLNILARWEEPDAGTLSFRGVDGAPPIAWREVAVVPQKLGLINELSVHENISLPLRLLPRDAAPQEHEDVDALIESLGLTRLADRLPLEVSVGEQQRAALARAMVLHPALLLLDEPTGHQDAEWMDAIFERLKAAAAMGACCLVATHNPEVLGFADRILEIRDGFLHETDAAALVAELEAEIYTPPTVPTDSTDTDPSISPPSSPPSSPPGPPDRDDSPWRRPT